uniref:Polyprotein n=1 Tax=Hansenia oviformis nepovirus TaxID=3115769 RepID=A0AAT9JB79_9SECO
MQWCDNFSWTVKATYARLQIALQCEPEKPLAHPDFPNLSRLPPQRQHEVLTSFLLNPNGCVTPDILEQLQDAEVELEEARLRLLRETAAAIAARKRCPTLGECIFYDVPGESQEIMQLRDALEAPTPEWEWMKKRPFWPKFDWFQDCKPGPYPEDYGDIPLGRTEELFTAFDALVEEHWRSIYSASFVDVVSPEPTCLPMFGMCVQSAGSLIPACMISSRHLGPNENRVEERAEAQDFADNSDSQQNLGDFWKEFYNKDSGKKISDSHKSRIASDPNKVGFTRSVLFHKQPLASTLAQTWASVRGRQDKAELVKISLDMNIEKEVIRLPDAVTTSAGPLYIKWTNLPRMEEDAARKLAEKGWNNADICGVDLAIKSHVAVGTPVRVVISLIDGACNDMPTATMCAFEVNLASQNNRSLNLPLLSLPFSTLLADLHDFQNRVKIACQFRDPEGFNPGTPMMSFSSLEFSELKQTAFERGSLLRDSWSEIEKRACHGGGRCIASQGVVQTWEKEVNPPLKECAPLILPPIPQPVRNFIDQRTGGSVKSLAQKSRSMRFQSPNDLWTRPSVDGGTTSTLRTLDTDKRSVEHQIPGCAYEVDPLHLMYYKNVNVPKDALEGVRLARIDLRKEAANMDSAVWRSWAKEGAIKPRITIRLSAASACFSGVCIGMFHDAYRKLEKQADGLSASLVTGLANQLWSLRGGDMFEWELNLQEVYGHTFYALSDKLGYMDFVLYIARGNELTSAADWNFHVAFYVDWSQEAFSALSVPTFVWPPTPECIQNFSEVRGPFSFDLNGTVQQIDHAFHPGTAIEVGGKLVRTLPRVCMAHYRSWTGKVRMSLEVVSSIFLTANFMVGVAWDTGADMDDMVTRKHWIVSSGEIFELDLYGPFGEFPTFLGSRNGSPHIIIQRLGGVLAPKDSTGSFGFFLRFHGLTGICKNPTLHAPEVGQRHAWFRLHSILNDSLVFNIPGRIQEIVADSTKYSVTNYTNPANLLFATTGLHGGVIEVFVTWCPNTSLGDASGSLKYMQYLYYTKDATYYGDQQTRTVIDLNGFSCQMRCGDFFGATNATQTGDIENLAIYSANATKIAEIRVSYRIVSMNFYGRTIKVD